MIAVRNFNLLGDTLYTLKPLAELHMQKPDEEIVIGVGPGFAGEMVGRQFSGLTRIVDVDKLPADAIDLSAGAAAKLGRAWRLENRPRHISQCFASILGVNVDHQIDMRPLIGWNYNSRGEWSPQRRRMIVESHPYVVIAPFSRSCSSHSGMRPNKTLAHDERWTPLLEWLEHDRGLEPVILVSPGDVWKGLDHVKRTTATSLGDLAYLLVGAAAVISVDNGIGHVASALGCRTYILWPPVSDVTFIGPTYNPGTRLLYMRPERVRADQLLSIVKKEMTR
jgi:hypothetical protein